jgi:hypothetical protein
MNMVLHFVIGNDFGMLYKNLYEDMKIDLNYNVSIFFLAISKYKK